MNQKKLIEKTKKQQKTNQDQPSYSYFQSNSPQSSTLTPTSIHSILHSTSQSQSQLQQYQIEQQINYQQNDVLFPFQKEINIKQSKYQQNLNSQLHRIQQIMHKIRITQTSIELHQRKIPNNISNFNDTNKSIYASTSSRPHSAPVITPDLMRRGRLEQQLVKERDMKQGFGKQTGRNNQMMDTNNQKQRSELNIIQIKRPQSAQQMTSSSYKQSQQQFLQSISPFDNNYRQKYNNELQDDDEFDENEQQQNSQTHYALIFLDNKAHKNEISQLNQQYSDDQEYEDLSDMNIISNQFQNNDKFSKRTKLSHSLLQLQISNKPSALLRPFQIMNYKNNKCNEQYLYLNHQNTQSSSLSLYSPSFPPLTQFEYEQRMRIIKQKKYNMNKNMNYVMKRNQNNKQSELYNFWNQTEVKLKILLQLYHRLQLRFGFDLIKFSLYIKQMKENIQLRMNGGQAINRNKEETIDINDNNVDNESEIQYKFRIQQEKQKEKQAKQELIFIEKDQIKKNINDDKDIEKKDSHRSVSGISFKFADNQDNNYNKDKSNVNNNNNNEININYINDKIKQNQFQKDNQQEEYKQSEKERLIKENQQREQKQREEQQRQLIEQQQREEQQRLLYEQQQRENKIRQQQEQEKQIREQERIKEMEQQKEKEKENEMKILQEQQDRDKREQLEQQIRISQERERNEIEKQIKEKEQMEKQLMEKEKEKRIKEENDRKQIEIQQKEKEQQEQLIRNEVEQKRKKDEQKILKYQEIIRNIDKQRDKELRSKQLILNSSNNNNNNPSNLIHNILTNYLPSKLHINTPNRSFSLPSVFSPIKSNTTHSNNLNNSFHNSMNNHLHPNFNLILSNLKEQIRNSLINLNSLRNQILCFTSLKRCSANVSVSESDNNEEENNKQKNKSKQKEKDKLSLTKSQSVISSSTQLSTFPYILSQQVLKSKAFSSFLILFSEVNIEKLVFKYWRMNEMYKILINWKNEIKRKKNKQKLDVSKRIKQKNKEEKEKQKELKQQQLDNKDNEKEKQKQKENEQEQGWNSKYNYKYGKQSHSSPVPHSSSQSLSQSFTQSSNPLNSPSIQQQNNKSNKVHPVATSTVIQQNKKQQQQVNNGQSQNIETLSMNSLPNNNNHPKFKQTNKSSIQTYQYNPLLSLSTISSPITSSSSQQPQQQQQQQSSNSKSQSMSYLLSLSGSNHSNPQNHSPIQRPNHNHPINIHPLSHSSPLNIKQSTNQYKQSHTNTSSPHPIPQSPNHPNQSQSQSTSTSILPSQSLPQQSNNSSSSSSYSSSSSTSHPISSTDNSSSSSSSSSSSYSSSSHNLITPFLHINKSLTGNGDSNLTTLEVIQETFIEEIQKLEPKEEIVIKPPYPLRVIRQKIPKKSKPVIVQTSSSNQTSPSLLQNPTKDQSMNTSVPQNEDKNETESEIESRKKKKRITRKYKKIVKEGDSETMSNQSEKQMKENINIGEDDDNVLKMKNKKILIRGHSTPLPNRIPLSSLLFVLSPSLLVSPSIQPLLSMQEKEREQLEQHHKEEDELLLKHKLIEKVILGRKEKKELEDQLLNHENERYQNERRRMVENRQMNEQQINNGKEKETYNKDQLNQKNEQESIKDDKGEQKSEKKWKLKSRKRRWRREVENSQSANEEQ